MFLYRNRREECGLSYLSDDDLPLMAVDAEGRMARFVARMCSGLVVLM